MVSSIAIGYYHYHYLVASTQPSPSARMLSSSSSSGGNNILKLVRKPRRFVLCNSKVLTGEMMSEGLFEAIEELESMTREPSDVLQQMNDRELQLVLLYFSQDGRDSWCALEVFHWLIQENRVDKETMELMVSIMCAWLTNLILSETHVSDIVDLLFEMDCVGLQPTFSMIDKAISIYWDLGKQAQAVSFVQELLTRPIIMSSHDHKEGPAGYLAWKMMEKGNYRDAVKLVIHLRQTGLNPQVYSYLIAMTAVVKELNVVAKALLKLKSFAKGGLVAELDEENIRLVEKFQADLLDEGILLSSWAVQEGNDSVLALVYKKLFAMYICAGRGLEAETQLWKMKLIGKEVERYFYDIVLAICASQRESAAVSRLLTILEATSSSCRKRTLTWLLRGYVKGKNFADAAATVTKMLDLGLRPDHLDRIAILQGLRRSIKQPGNVEAYLGLCKHLSDAELIGPCLVYMYIRRFRLWIVKMI
ncbi:hypothetical protein RND81_05G273800 [Saponaria officinalis]|uniref:Pentatricopeptide repeat-containing protein n=1 Tax=Saponaria officinalis TaxID=3572 RepID=A0AAW1L1F7_SAPOF